MTFETDSKRRQKNGLKKRINTGTAPNLVFLHTLAVVF